MKLQISWKIYFNILTQSEEQDHWFNFFTNCLLLKNKVTESNAAALSFT